ncbi:MAG: hypothetical protein H6740_27830 [Alphaproteobacteria bacterium]|nr:hypothetical protein [Alphaproteobacteria bacterium]
MSARVRRSAPRRGMLAGMRRAGSRLPGWITTASLAAALGALLRAQATWSGASPRTLTEALIGAAIGLSVAVGLRLPPARPGLRFGAAVLGLLAAVGLTTLLPVPPAAWAGGALVRPGRRPAPAGTGALLRVC